MNELICRTDIENKLMVTKGERGMLPSHFSHVRLCVTP